MPFKTLRAVQVQDHTRDKPVQKKNLDMPHNPQLIVNFTLEVAYYRIIYKSEAETKPEEKYDRALQWEQDTTRAHRTSSQANRSRVIMLERICGNKLHVLFSFSCSVGRSWSQNLCIQNLVQVQD